MMETRNKARDLGTNLITIRGVSDGIDDKFERSRFGDNPSHKIDEQVQESVHKAATERMSQQGCEGLHPILKKHNIIFKLNLGSGSPANITPMMISLYANKKPNRVRDRRYPAGKRENLEPYLYQLVQYGIFVQDATASRQTAHSTSCLSLIAVQIENNNRSETL